MTTNDEHCRAWNRLPLERRKGIVEQAAAVATELKALNLTLRRLREAGATQHVEFMLGEQRSYDSPPPDG